MSSINLFRRLQDLQPDAPVMTGQVTGVNADGTASVQMTVGGVLVARNPLAVQASQHVFVQAGAITGTAPDLPYLRIEI